VANIGTGGGAYWEVARPHFVLNRQALLLALPLFCLQIDFSSISYCTDSYNHACIKIPIQNLHIFEKKQCRQLLMASSIDLLPGALPLHPLGHGPKTPLLPAHFE